MPSILSPLLRITIDLGAGRCRLSPHLLKLLLARLRGGVDDLLFEAEYAGLYCQLRSRVDSRETHLA